MELKDLNLSGASKVTGGEYKNVKISGASEVSSDIICDKMDISGAITVQGNIKATSCKVSGACQINGGISSTDLKISGGAKIRGDIKGKNISIAGATKVEGSIKADVIKLAGGVSVGRDMECEEFYLDGSVRSKGTVNCEKCEINIYADSEIEELVGGTIRIHKGYQLRNSWAGIQAFISKIKGYIRLKTIEGDDVYLENTICDIVRGTNVVIGPDCKIGCVEYSNKLDIHDSSTVDEKVAIS